MTRLRTVAWTVGAILVTVAIGGWILLRAGVSARDEPPGVERWMARAARHAAIPAAARALRNPVALDTRVLAEARAHFADHCASCHDNDGSGRTVLGQSLYPKGPDMRAPATQSLSDGEIGRAHV